MCSPVPAVSAVQAVLGPAVWLACSKAQYGHLEAASGMLARLFFKPDSWTGFAGKGAEGQKCMVYASRPKVTHPRCFFIQQR